MPPLSVMRLVSHPTFNSKRKLWFWFKMLLPRVDSLARLKLAGMMLLLNYTRMELTIWTSRIPPVAWKAYQLVSGIHQGIRHCLHWGCLWLGSLGGLKQHDRCHSNSKCREEGNCNSLLLKFNQIGTVTESIKAHLLAKSNGWGTIVLSSFRWNWEYLHCWFGCGLIRSRLALLAVRNVWPSTIKFFALKRNWELRDAGNSFRKP